MTGAYSLNRVDFTKESVDLWKAKTLTIDGIEEARIQGTVSCCGYAEYKCIFQEEVENVTKALKEILLTNAERGDGFGAVIAYEVEEQNIAEMVQHGWKLLSTSQNPGTGNTVHGMELQ